MHATTFVDVGGCGFKSVAVWLINYIEKANEFWLKQAWLATVWKYLCATTPEYSKIPTRNALPGQKVQHIILTESKEKTVQLITQILANMACEELSTYPTRYRDFLLESDKLHITTNFFWLKSNRMYMVALARAMCVSLTILSFIQQNKIYKLTYLSDENTKSFDAHITLRHDKSDYFKILMPQQDWTKNITTLSNLTMSDEYSATLEWIQTKITTDEKLILKRYHETCLKIINQWIQGIFTKDQGIELYIKLLTDPKFSLNKMHNQRYFEYLFNKYPQPDLSEWQQVDHDFTRQLIQAVARLSVI